MIERVIDLKALEHNYGEVLKLTRGQNIMAVVKSNAYGHGIREVSLKLYSLGVRRFLISSVNDYKPVSDFPAEFLLLYYDTFDRQTLQELSDRDNVVFNLYGWEALNSLPKGSRVHIEIDTGMNRTGIKPDDFEGFYKKAKERFRVEGVFTHFPKAYDMEFSRKQIEIFEDLTKGLPVKRHINNSLGLLNFGPIYDFSRVGILLYGYGHKSLKPVKEVYSRVIQVKRVKKGETVSYDGAFVCEDGFLGIVPIGYALGLRRCKDFEVFINGKFVKVAGWITMDTFMVFSKDDDIKVGDRVEILGKNNSADKIAKIWETIPYEVLTSLP
ncbi:MAG: alanine racemase [candidate division WOR-3 bacterium]